MDYNKFIPILGLLLLMILAIGSISASEVDIDSNSVGDNLANIDLTEEGQSVNTVDNSYIDDDVYTDNIQSVDSNGDGVDLNNPQSFDSNEDNIDTSSNVENFVSDDVEQNSVDVKNNLKSSNLASTYKFKSSNYNTYFNSSGNIISGKLKSGDIIDFSGSFSGKTFIINIPLTLTSTDGTAKFVNCAFKFVEGADGSNISNLDAKQIKNEHTPVFAATSVSNLTFTNNTVFSNQTKSFPMSFTNVTGINVFNNKVQVNSYVKGASQPSLIVFFGGSGCNISSNTVITNDSNGIYFSAFGSGGESGQNSANTMYSNYIFNNTVYSVRALPSSFSYPIQVMGKDSIILNNTIHDAYVGISCTSTGNQIIGNKIYNIHGAYYSTDTEEKGGGYPIYVDEGCIIKDNLIFDSNLKDTSAAIGVGEGSTVSGNIIRNVNGSGVIFTGNNISFINNTLNVTGIGAMVSGNSSKITIEANVFDTNDKSSVSIKKQSTRIYPHEIIVQNNTFYTTADEAITVDEICKDIFISNNIIIGSSGIPDPDDGNSTHYINEANFHKYFDVVGTLSGKIKENDTLIFLGPISSKGKLHINNKVSILGQNAVFNDTTFIIDNDDVIIDNITINNPNLSNMDRLWGIQINNVSNVTIQNCNISIYDPFSAFAIYILDSSNCSVINNILDAQGNYFTATILSFNSRDLYINGNSLKTLGSGETYLVNNKSCLDGYLNYYANVCMDGTVICPDGYTICPDGSLLCPDGVTTIAAEDYRICVDGTVVCVDGTIICADGTTVSYTDSNICPDGSVCVDGTTYCLDGTIEYADGRKLVAGGYVICIDGSVLCPDGSVINSEDCELCPDGSIVCTDGTTICPDGSVICPDGSTICPDGSVVCPDGSVICADGTTICPDGSVICADGTTICPDGSVVCADGTVVCPDGSVLCPDGTTYAPGEYETDENGCIICPDGTTICPNGTIICADGTTICPDGSGSSNILDGVIPGSHMVSGLYRTYGFLMVHSSNVTFTNNVVNVSSALGENYDLNESYNTIAGVFIHYGGFNNNVSNNSIVLSSNDPVVYGIGIIGAPMNSTAIGSANNTFTYNNISLNGSYITVGLLLGNKAIDSDIEYNYFRIVSGRQSPNIVNYNTSANNLVENNIFNSTLATAFSFENITVTIKEAYNESIIFKVTLKDKEGHVLSSKLVSLTFNNAETNSTTDENGSISLELNIKEAGTYNILIEFAGDDDYIPTSAIGIISVLKLKTSLTVSNVSYKTTAATKTVSATLKDENGLPIAGKKIKFTVNGKNYTATTNAKGVATAKISLTAGGTYTISASFASDANYSASSAKGKLTLTKQSTSLTSSGKTYIVTNTAKYIYVTIKDASKKLLSGKKITATVNGKTFSAKTNSKGEAKIKLTLNTVKTFTVSLKFAGDSTYSASTKSIKVKVIKTKTKLTVPNKTYKKATKAKKLTATLKDQTGKVVKSKKVQFTVNGKKYSAKTNNKGVVTVNVNLSKKKTYKFTVKFAGDSKYYAVTKTGKVIIK